MFIIIIKIFQEPVARILDIYKIVEATQRHLIAPLKMEKQTQGKNNQRFSQRTRIINL